MKARVAFVHFGSARSEDMSRALRWSWCLMRDLAFAYFGHSRRKCSTVSFALGQCGHLGDSALVMRCKWLFNGACPVRSWNRIAACRFGRSSTSFKKFLDGRVGSIFWAQGARGEDSNIFFCNDFVHPWHQFRDAPTPLGGGFFVERN